MPEYAQDYTTLDSFKNRRDLNVNTDDAMVVKFIRDASVWFAEKANRMFVPFEATYTYDRFGGHITARTLDLGEDVLAVGTLTNGDGTVIAASSFRLTPTNSDPKWRIELLPSAAVTWTHETDWQDAISVSGIYGYHRHYAQAWKANTQLNGTLGVSGTLVSVDSVSALEVLDYILVGAEQMQVTDTITGTLTVERGVNGTTAASHADDTSVLRYQQTASVKEAVETLAAFFYEHRDTDGRSVQVAGGAIFFEGQIPPAVWSVLADVQRSEMWAR